MLHAVKLWLPKYTSKYTSYHLTKTILIQFVTPLRTQKFRPSRVAEVVEGPLTLKLMEILTAQVLMDVFIQPLLILMVILENFKRDNRSAAIERNGHGGGPQDL